jgi:hypothetical protein
MRRRAHRLGRACVSYVIAEIGAGKSGLTGWGWLVGPVARVSPDAGGGLSFRLAADIFLLEVGFRGVVAFGDVTSGQGTITLGFGRF